MDRLSWAELGNELSGIGRNDGLDRGGLAELSMRKMMEHRSAKGREGNLYYTFN